MDPGVQPNAQVTIITDQDELNKQIERIFTETGQPMMRSLQLLAPEASTYAYFLGRDLLVVPVVEPDVAEWPVYLPVGRWVNLWNGELLDGGRTLTVKTPIDHIPVFVRHGAQIPVHLAPSGRLGDGVTLTVEPNQMLAWG